MSRPELPELIAETPPRRRCPSREVAELRPVAPEESGGELKPDEGGGEEGKADGE